MAKYKKTAYVLSADETPFRITNHVVAREIANQARLNDLDESFELCPRPGKGRRKVLITITVETIDKVKP